jgi:hypothetical protein
MIILLFSKILANHSFGVKIFWRETFWRENFGGKILAGKFWRENAYPIA